MLLNELVSTDAAVSATRSRLAKVDALSALLARLEREEVAPALGLLIGSPVQGRLGVDKAMVAVENTRSGIGKHSMVLNDATPHVEVDPETYEVRADGELLTREPATVLPMAQRYFLF